MITERKLSNKITQLINDGGIGVIPTDTIYGLVGSALSKRSVKRIYKTRKRDSNKPVIVLIGKVNDLDLFGVKPNKNTKTILEKAWPGKVSIIIPTLSDKFRYLHRGKGSIAFRLPKNATLRKFLEKTGPLVAPSANPQGMPPATNIKEAKKYFGDRVDFYVDKGRLTSEPSALIQATHGELKILRSNSYIKKLSELFS